MNFSWQGLIATIVVIVLIDAGKILLTQDRHFLSPLHRWARLGWDYFVPVIYIILFGIYFFAIPMASSPDIYRSFGWMTLSFVLIYIPRSLWTLGLAATSLHYKIKRKTEADTLFKKPEKHKIPYPRISRKKFLSQIGIIIATAPMASILFGALKGRFRFQTRYQELHFPHLPQAFHGLRIVHISDLHLGSFKGNEAALQEAVEMINRETPHLIVFTGDLVNNFYQETVGFEPILNQLKATIGKYSILGNHDYGHYSNWRSETARQHNFDEIVKANERLGFTLLRNEHVVLHRHDQTIAMAGVEYWGNPSRHGNTGDLTKASHGIDQVDFKILLSHDPTHWDAQVVGNTNYALTLAGHTHGMQMGIDYKGLKWSPAQWKFRHWDGLYRHKNQYLFVNRGLGVLGMPTRIGMLPEITVLELKRENLN